MSKGKKIMDKVIDIAKHLRARSRKLHKGMPAGGFHSSRKKGYTRKVKHKGEAE